MNAISFDPSPCHVSLAHSRGFSNTLADLQHEGLNEDAAQITAALLFLSSWGQLGKAFFRSEPEQQKWDGVCAAMHNELLGYFSEHHSAIMGSDDWKEIGGAMSVPRAQQLAFDEGCLLIGGDRDRAAVRFICFTLRAWSKQRLFKNMRSHCALIHNFLLKYT